MSKKMKILCPRCDTPLDSRFACTRCHRDFSPEVHANIDREELTGEQTDAQDHIDNACGDLIRQFAPAFEHDAEQVGTIRDALIDVLQKFYHVPEYDAYPWMLSPEEENSTAGPTHGAPSRPTRTFSAHEGEQIIVHASLANIGDAEEQPGPLNVSISVDRNGINITVPEVDTHNDAPLHAAPIYIEQNDGKLALYAWDNTQEDPVLEKKWKRIYSEDRPVIITAEYCTEEAQRKCLRSESGVFDGTTLQEATDKMEAFFTGKLESGLKGKTGSGTDAVYEYNNGDVLTITNTEIYGEEQ